jgi:hypothetical protein
MFFMLYSAKYINYTRLRVKNVFTYYLDRGICFADPFFLASIAAVSLTVVLKDPQPLIGVPPIYLLITVWLNFERIDRSIPPINTQLKDYLIRQKDALIRKIKNEPRVREPLSLHQLTGDIPAFFKRLDDIVLISDIRNISLYSLFIGAELEKYPDKRIENAVILYFDYLCRFLREFEECERLYKEYTTALRKITGNSAVSIYKKLSYTYKLRNLKDRKQLIKRFVWDLSQNLRDITHNFNSAGINFKDTREFIIDLKERRLIN